MKYLIYPLLTFVIVYLSYELLLLRRKNKINNIYKSTEVVILNKFLHVDTNKMEAKFLTRIIAVVNALIIAITLEIVLLATNKILLQMLLGFIILLVLIIIIYPIIAIFLRKKYGKF